MSFTVSLLLFILGSALVALCLIAIPGRGGHGDAAATPPHGHGVGHH